MKTLLLFIALMALPLNAQKVSVCGPAVGEDMATGQMLFAEPASWNFSRMGAATLAYPVQFAMPSNAAPGWMPGTGAFVQAALLHPPVMPGFGWMSDGQNYLYLNGIEYPCQPLVNFLYLQYASNHHL